MATIDAYQGEEAKIVLASLVRTRGLGFLNDKRRVNVLCSRARDGLVLVGNVDNLKKSLVWLPVLRYFATPKVATMGPTFPVQCAHGIVTVSSPEEFATLSPGGGCQKLCQAVLPCGHPCQFPCHGNRTAVHANQHCSYEVTSHCLKGHLQMIACSQRGHTTCVLCQQLAEQQRQHEAAMRQLKRQQQQQDLELDQKLKAEALELTAAAQQADHQRKTDVQLAALRLQHAQVLQAKTAEDAVHQRQLQDAELAATNARLEAQKQQFTSMEHHQALMAPLSARADLLAADRARLEAALYPPNWTSTALERATECHLVDVSATHLPEIQALVDATSAAERLGHGRDQRINGQYHKLTVTKVSKIWDWRWQKK